MCAVLAPLPPFWYAVFPNGEDKGAGGDQREVKPNSDSKNNHVKAIDFTIGDNGAAHFVAKEEELAPLLFARDKDESTTHKQMDHPSDSYWKQITVESRRAAEYLTDVQLLRCSILPFFNQYIGTGNRLYYYDFKHGKPIFSNSKGDFVSSDLVHLKNFALPKTVGGEKGFYEKKAKKKQVIRKSSIYKFQPKKELKVKKISVTTPAFLPPIPRGYLAELVEEDEGIMAAERYLLAEPEDQHAESRPHSITRPRTKQDMRLKDNSGSLFIGFSGMQRPLAPVSIDTIDGRGATPWLDREEGDERSDIELDFMLAPGFFHYESLRA